MEDQQKGEDESAEMIQEGVKEMKGYHPSSEMSEDWVRKQEKPQAVRKP